jgi:hypothetical protein
MPLLTSSRFASLKVNYMTIPVYVLGAISLVVQVYFSDKYKKRAVFICGSCIPVAVGYLVCVGSSSPNAGYAGMFILVTGKLYLIDLLVLQSNILLGIFPISTLAVTWVAGNLAPDSKRAIGLPLAYSIGNISNLLSSQLYPTSQGPRYVVGNAVSAGLTVVAAFLYGAVWFLLRHRNQQKAKLIAEGATVNGKEGDEALDEMYIL